MEQEQEISIIDVGNAVFSVFQNTEKIARAMTLLAGYVQGCAYKVSSDTERLMLASQYFLDWQKSFKCISEENEQFFSKVMSGFKIKDSVVYLFRRLEVSNEFYRLVEDFVGNFAGSFADSNIDSDRCYTVCKDKEY